MSLETRTRNMDRFCERSGGRRVCPFMVEVPVEPRRLKKLKFAVRVYLAASLGLDLDASTDDVFAAFHAQGERAPNSATSGLLRPYRDLTLEANLAFRAYIEVLTSLNIGDFVKRWNVPMIRYKCAEPHFDSSLMERPTQTDHWHLDPWVGEFPRSINTMIPLFGDIKGNHVKFAMPGSDFQENWVRTLPGRYTSLEAKGMLQTAQPIDYMWQDGHVLLVDAATFHKTHREPNAGPRVSIDTMCSWDDPTPEEVSGRLGIVTTTEFLEIGQKRVFYSPDPVDQPHVGGENQRDFRLGTVPLALAP